MRGACGLGPCKDARAEASGATHLSGGGTRRDPEELREREESHMRRVARLRPLETRERPRSLPA